jgi:hypothetical protein
MYRQGQQDCDFAVKDSFSYFPFLDVLNQQRGSSRLHYYDYEWVLDLSGRG